MNRAIRAILIKTPRLGGTLVDQQNNLDPAPTPKDAREATEEQRRLQEQLEHRDGDPDAPGLHQSRHDVADESRR
ncbi:hypothetical protein AWB93_05670 [Mycobacterium bohemicum]|uniref:Uncharacterized protein n=1 Tax=Mycobacterium bohemicum TaxID=56425 RepID=A0A1X1RAM4_MYCBE|nr:hypothetical protein AWB93_05670 [Mycobacterium bohemicum]